MPNTITLLEPVKHAQMKFSAPDCSYVSEQHILPIALHEFSKAACEYPIVFVKNADTGQFQSVIMLGLKPEQNLSVKDGKWLSTYAPALVRDYPLAVMINNEEPEKLWIGVKEKSPMVNYEVGEPLFEGGEETPFFEQRRKAIIQHFEEEQTSQALIGLFAEKDLFKQQTLTVEVAGEKRNINGLYLIDEQKLNALPDETFLDFKKRGLLTPIYNHLTSLNQIIRLAKAETELAETA